MMSTELISAIEPTPTVVAGYPFTVTVVIPAFNEGASIEALVKELRDVADWREILVTTPRLGESVSGAILYDETIRQQLKDGTPFVKALNESPPSSDR